MNRLIYSVAAMSFTLAAAAQTPRFTVSEPRALQADAPGAMYHPVFSPDGNSLFVSAEDYSGLSIVDLNTGHSRRLTDMPGAGYRFAISEGGDAVVVRQINADDLSISLYTLDVVTGASNLVAPRIAHTNAVTLQGGSLSWAQNEAMTATPVRTRLSAPAKKATAPAVMVTEEDLKMVVYTNGERHVVDPILDTTGNDYNYCWTSLSPDGSHLLFVAHGVCYTCALDGSDLVKLGNIHAPVWRDNDYVVGMVDGDDGHVITSGEIVIAHRDATGLQQLTPEGTQTISMFPSVSPDGSQVAYNTADGRIFIIDITQN